MFNFINAFGFQVSFDAEAFKASAKKAANKVTDKTLEGASWALNKAEQKVSQWRTEKANGVIDAETVEFLDEIPVEEITTDSDTEERDWYTELYEAGLDWGRAIKDGDDEWCLAASDNAVYTLNDAIRAGMNPVLANDLLIKGKMSA